MTTKLFKATLLVLILQACGEEHQFFPQLEDADESSVKVKFIHAASDTVGVNLFLNDTQITGNPSSTITTAGSVNYGLVNIGAVTFGAGFPVTNYAYVKNASGIFATVVPETYSATVTYPVKTMATKEGSLNASSFYTVAFVGVSPAYETLVYEDNIAATPINGKAYIRVGNFIHNSSDNITIKGTPPVTTDDPTPVEITLFTNVPYKTMSDFIELPRTGTYTGLKIVNAVTNATIATATAANSFFADNKVYTLVVRGQIGQTGATNVKTPALTRVINR